ncbi:MAG: CarD family transcriptional regulator [bacterium]
MKCFKPGDLAVYPNYGVGEVVSIEHRPMGDTEVKCYVVSMMSNGSKVFVPVESADRMGLRTVTNRKNAEDVYSCFKSRNFDLLKMNWNKRYRYLQDKMKTGKIVDVASVVSDLLFLKKKKGLSYGEDKLLTEAEEILSTELSISENLPKDDVISKIHSSFKK